MIAIDLSFNLFPPKLRHSTLSNLPLSAATPSEVILLSPKYQKWNSGRCPKWLKGLQLLVPSLPRLLFCYYWAIATKVDWLSQNSTRRDTLSDRSHYHLHRNALTEYESVEGGEVHPRKVIDRLVVQSALLERKFPDCRKIHGAKFHGVVVVHGVVL
jgi:hypothetical protein